MLPCQVKTDLACDQCVYYFSPIICTLFSLFIGLCGLTGAGQLEAPGCIRPNGLIHSSGGVGCCIWSHVALKYQFIMQSLFTDKIDRGLV